MSTNADLSVNIKAQGTYVLRFRCQRKWQVEVGCCGRLELQAGVYFYVGSAKGSGGLRARVARHMRASENKHWHIDYIKPYLTMEGAWLTSSRECLEHRWARALQNLSALEVPLPKFGASDCACESHLFYAIKEGGCIDRQLKKTCLDGDVMFYRYASLQKLFDA